MPGFSHAFVGKRSDELPSVGQSSTEESESSSSDTLLQGKPSETNEDFLNDLFSHESAKDELMLPSDNNKSTDIRSGVHLDSTVIEEVASQGDKSSVKDDNALQSTGTEAEKSETETAKTGNSPSKT